MNTIVYYHKNCSDGFGAAFAAWKEFGADAAYEPLQYGKTPDVGGFDRVFFLDVVPQPYETIYDVARQTGQVTVIDHHKTTIEHFAYEGRGEAQQFIKRNIEFNFDMGHSAAVLTHQYFNPGKVTPWLMEYVEDRDMWWHKLAKSAEVNAAIRSYPMHFLVWDKFVSPNDMAKVGEHVLRTERIYWGRSLENVQWIKIAGYLTPIVNTTVGGSDAANALLDIYPKADISGYYFDRGDGLRQWGLRSKGKVDVGEVAAQFGGGGHAKAAGFQTAINEVPRSKTSDWFREAVA